MASAVEQFYKWKDERDPSVHKDGATVINAKEFFYLLLSLSLPVKKSLFYSYNEDSKFVL